MCDLCSADPEVKAQARADHSDMAHRLARLSAMYLGLAEGKIKPHTDKAAETGIAARAVLRRLVMEWI